VIIPRAEHCVSRADISDSALKVLYRLKDADYEAYLVGGGVRDLLLGMKPKDFDVATDAHPEQAQQAFRNSRLIGRRFRLLHVRFGREIIEVATFRAHHDEQSDHSEHHSHIRDGMLVRDNVYGTLEEDAWRRDFTINALYYNIRDFSVLDYTGGMQDLQARLIRVIGDPEKRYREDPVRMLRAVRLAAKLDFSIEEHSSQAIALLKDRLTAVPPARLFDEILKLFLTGHAVKSLEQLRRNEVLSYLFPVTADLLDKDPVFEKLVIQGLINTDERIAENKPVTPAFLFAIFLWRPVALLAQRLQQQNMSELQAMQAASEDVLAQQGSQVALPRRYSLQTREIWLLQARLRNRSGKRVYRTYSHPRFRAGYDFLLLRHQAGEADLASLCEWWTDFQAQTEHGQQDMIAAVKSDRQSKPRRRRRRKRPRRAPE
jgi:poly(A) polymerase